MDGFLDTLSRHAFLQHAILAGILASIGCGIAGTYVVVKRIGYLAGGIAHAVLGGMGAAYFFGASPLGGAFAAAWISAMLIGWVHLRWREREDTLIGALWAVGMAVGILFLSRAPGYSVDLMSYLFGNILMVSRTEVGYMLAADLLIVAVTVVWRRPFLAVCFDEEYATLRGLRVEAIYLLLLCTVAVTVVLLIQVVGLILVIALLTLPAAIALQYFWSISRIMIASILLGALFTAGGLAVSFSQDLPAGATIILLAGSAYLVSTAIASFKRK